MQRKQVKEIQEVVARYKIICCFRAVIMTASFVFVAALLQLLPVAAWDVARTPPMVRAMVVVDGCKLRVLCYLISPTPTLQGCVRGWARNDQVNVSLTPTLFYSRCLSFNTWVSSIPGSPPFAPPKRRHPTFLPFFLSSLFLLLFLTLDAPEPLPLRRLCCGAQ